MIIAIDTRQQAGRHVEKNIYFKEHGHKTVRTKLFVGDYALLHDQTLCIDTKRTITELAGNICGKQHERFRNECVRAHDTGIQLIILVEQIPPHNNLDEWTSSVTQIKGSTLKKAMETMTERYGVQFEFCRTSDTAKRIVDILWSRQK